MHPTYKHLEDRVRLGGLTLGQWAQLLACGLAAYMLSTLLPLPGSWSVSVAVTVCGLPAAGTIAVMHGELDVPRLVGAALRWRREPKHYAGTRGLLSADRASVGAAGSAGAPSASFEAEALWD